MITLENLTKVYTTDTGKVSALKGINLHINRGEIYGIIGLSGAGKSTLIRCINMLEVPTTGKVIVGDKDLTKLTTGELREERRHIGMIFQHFNLLSSATVYDNVAFPLRLQNSSDSDIKTRVTELLGLVGLADKASQYPSQLSGGQKQRVGIARALADAPKVLLCDEATSALDPQTTKSILELIRSINQKLQLTVVIITHEMQVIKDICDRVAVIDGGVIAEEGSVTEIFTNPQQPITREFISVLLSNDLPAAFRGNPIESEPSEDSYLLLRLTFIGERADEPVIAGMIRAFPSLEVSLLFGSLDHIKVTPFGRMVIGLRGKESEIDAAMKYLQAQDLKEEVIGYVRRNNSASN